MVWVRFSAPMDWKPRPPVTIAFKAGDVRNVTRACAAAAIARGAAEKTERPEDASRSYARTTVLSAARDRR
jgi:hypothetical protein